MSHSVKIFKLSNNDMIIGIIEEDDLGIKPLDGDEVDNEIVFNDFCLPIHFPFRMNSEYNRENRTHEIFLEDYTPFSKETCSYIFKDKIVLITEPSQEVFELYESHQQQLALDLMEHNMELNEMDKMDENDLTANPKVNKKNKIKKKTAKQVREEVEQIKKERGMQILKMANFDKDDIH
jgi:hypothetical protein